MTQSHLFSLGSLAPQQKTAYGTRADATANNFPTLKTMALSLLTLGPKGVREPHWHPNANELSYVLEGNGMMTLFTPGSIHDTFTIEAGEIAFVPRSCIHHIENTGDTPLRMLVCFDNSLPEDLNLSAGVSVMPEHILADTCHVDAEFFEKLKKTDTGVFISQRDKAAIPPLPFMTNRFKMALQATHPEIATAGGTVKMSNSFLMPSLDGLSIYSVLLKPNGAREPHWHPNADELNYLISGTARITLLSPGGSVATFDMKAGDMSFLPRGYLHHIENTGTDDAFFAIFFNNTAPSDIGFSGCLGAYSNEVLASIFGVKPEYFANFPKIQQDLFVVSGGG